MYKTVRDTRLKNIDIVVRIVFFTLHMLLGGYSIVNLPQELHEYASTWKAWKERWNEVISALFWSPLRPCNLVLSGELSRCPLASVSLWAYGWDTGIMFQKHIFSCLSASHGWSISLKTNSLPAFLAPGGEMGIRNPEPCVLFRFTSLALIYEVLFIFPYYVCNNLLSCNLTFRLWIFFKLFDMIC